MTGEVVSYLSDDPVAGGAWIPATGDVLISSKWDDIAAFRTREAGKQQLGNFRC